MRTKLADTLRALAGRLLTPAVEAALSVVDLTDLVARHVDLDSLAARLDVDAVVARADLDAVMATGRTYGGAVLGVRVLSARRRLLGRTRSLRAVACVLVPIGLLWVAISASRRSLQDLLFGSWVVYDWNQDGGARVTAGEAPKI